MDPGSLQKLQLQDNLSCIKRNPHKVIIVLLLSISPAEHVTKTLHPSSSPEKRTFFDKHLQRYG
jgi:hypothetical protein